jgi:TonB family protein
MGRFIGVLSAVAVHALVLLFGGIFFLREGPDQGSLREVELLAAQAPEAEKKPDEPEEPSKGPTEELAANEEEAPDSAELMRNLELASIQPAPALEAASLGAIADALSGLGSSAGDFGDALTFASGGRIGGTGKPGALDASLESALSLAEIDQKPRAIFQASPLYPSEMRGKKLEGTVTLLFIVDATGKVSEPRVEQSSHPAFERPALEAVRQWKFEPAVKGGRRVSCKMRVPIRFQPS